jgi:putative NADH-flavin reductase
MYADLRQMEALIKKSDLDWTIIRPPQLADKTVTDHYRTAINKFLKNCLKISRSDVAERLYAPTGCAPGSAFLPSR